MLNEIRTRLDVENMAQHFGGELKWPVDSSRVKVPADMLLESGSMVTSASEGLCTIYSKAARGRS